MSATSKLKSFFLHLFFILPIITIFTSSALSIHAQEPLPEVTIGVREIAPFVIKEDGKYKGFSIDLMEQIAKKSGISISEYKTYPNVGELIDSVENGQSQVGIAAISITEEREKRIDFTQPMFNSGLKILVPNGKAAKAQDSSIFSKMWIAIKSREFLWLVLITLIISLIPAHIMYFIEGIREKGMFSKNYFHGIAQAFGWTLNTIAIGPSEQPNTRIGKIVTLIWVYLGIIFVAFFTATITSDLTTEKLQGSINSVADLPGQSVVSIRNSTASTFLNKMNINHTLVDNSNEAFKEVSEGKVDAFVYDAPALEYYANTEGNGKVVTVGEMFKAEEYGIALPKNSPYREKFDQALLSLKENGEYQTLYQKWFGKSL
jgi:polar amino acid transport system substrate-binding protein